MTKYRPSASAVMCVISAMATVVFGAMGFHQTGSELFIWIGAFAVFVMGFVCGGEFGVYRWKPIADEALAMCRQLLKERGA